MDFPALAQRLIYPRTDTPEAAWDAAVNSVFAGGILGVNRLLFATLALASPAPIGPGLANVGIGLVYLVMARIAYRRSRLASAVILVLAVLEVLIEVTLKAQFGLSFAVAAIGLVLAIGGFRGAHAIFSRHRKLRS